MIERSLSDLLRSIIGLSCESIGMETVKRIVERRMAEAGTKTLTDYIALVSRSESEKQRLIDHITVPETWFFRDHEPFKFLAEHLRGTRSNLGTKPLKVLSVPCSTGEEPYSIAMVLLDIGYDASKVQIDAVDISRSVIEKAEIGVYGDNSFRGKELSFRSRYFTEQKGRFLIASRVKEMVRFFNHNILEPGFMQGRGPYDVVFCRNLMIYFDLETKVKALAILHGLMKEDALLFLGHAETGRMADGLFEFLRLPGAFAYRKLAGGEGKSFAYDPVRGVRLPRHPVPPSTKRGVLESAVIDPDCNGEGKVKSRDERLAEIQRMADQGRLNDALQACECFLANVPDSAECYYLKGVIELAKDDNHAAMNSFKRALYLDSKHYHALIHLAVLAEEAGEVRKAENYRARAERLESLGLANQE